MLPYIAFALMGVLIVLAIVVSMQPGDFRVERSATISAPAPAVFGLVNDFHKWTAWSPWEKIDPDLKRTYAGSNSGVGAVYSWSGNNKAGEGRMTILESKPYETIRIKLEFIKPFKAVNTAQFDFKPEGGRTAATWSMTGQKNFISKAFCMFMSMDKMVGGDFEKGLANLDAAAQAAAKQ